MRRELQHTMLFAEAGDVGARMPRDCPERKTGIDGQQSIGCQHLRSGVDDGTRCLWTADHSGDDERGKVVRRRSSLTELAEVVEDVRSRANLGDVWALDREAECPRRADRNRRQRNAARANQF